MRRYFITIFLLLVGMGLWAQNRQSVTGTVVDRKNNPLEGVTITSDLGGEMVVTDPDGRFEVSIDDGEKLQFRKDGFETQQLDGKDGMTIQLQKSGNDGHFAGSYLRLAGGYPLTLLDGQLSIADGKGNRFVLKADHEAKWGFKTLEWSALNAEFSHRFRKSIVYAKAGGANLFFTRYGRYYQADTKTHAIPDKYSSLQAADHQAIWRATAAVGVRSTEGLPLQYKAELTGQTYTYQGMMTEYQLNLRTNIEHHWVGEKTDQKLGVNYYTEYRRVGLSDSTAAYYERRNLHLNPVFAIRIEPFYAYMYERLSVHLGVNLDINVGKGNLHSLTTDETPFDRQVSFAPSPNIRLKMQLTPWAMLYADVLGTFGTSTMTGYVRLNPYINVIGAPSSHHVSGYTPADARLGVLLRPHSDLLIQLDAGYRYVLNSVECSATQNADGLYQWNMMGLVYVDFQRWKTGVELTYHYRDYFLMHLTADGYFYRGIKHNTTGAKLGDRGTDFCTEGRMYDRPLWETSVRLEGHPDSHWNIYSDNTFQGRRWAITSLGDRQLPAFVDMNLGAGYQFGQTGRPALDKLYLFAELKNILNRHNMVWYGYESPGIQGLLGLRIAM